jgi:hypothetical protein
LIINQKRKKMCCAAVVVKHNTNFVWCNKCSIYYMIHWVSAAVEKKKTKKEHGDWGRV